MPLMKRAGNILFMTAAGAALVSLGSGLAMAATTLTVKVANGGTYTATASKTVLSDNGVSVTCTTTGTTHASRGSGTVATASHTGTSPVTVGTVAKLSFGNCSGPLGRVTTKVSGTPYSIRVDSKTNGSGQTDGMISGVKVSVSMTGCSFTVTGSSPGFYTNSKHTLTMTTAGKLPVKPLNSARLTVSGVSGCAGLVTNGDHPTYVSTYAISRKLTIKSS